MGIPWIRLDRLAHCKNAQLDILRVILQSEIGLNWTETWGMWGHPVPTVHHGDMYSPGTKLTGALITR